MNKSKRIKNILKIGITIGTLIPLTSCNSDSTNNTLFEYSKRNIQDYDSYILQGICLVDNKYYITAYDGKFKKNSILLCYDEDNNKVLEKELYNDAHVGGITYDPNNEIFWITDINGTISGYEKNTITIDNDKIVYPLYEQVDTSNLMYNYSNELSIAYVEYNDNKLYVGNFNNGDDSYLKEYTINNDGTLDLDSESIKHITSNIQGITFTKKDDITYLLTSSSFGKYLQSELTIYQYDKTIDDYRKETSVSYYMPPMSENLVVDNNGNLVTLFESNAKKYETVTNPNPSDIITYDIDKVLSLKK